MTNVQLQTAALRRLEIENSEETKSEEHWEKIWTNSKIKEACLQAGGPNKDDGRRTRQRKGRTTWTGAEKEKEGRWKAGEINLSREEKLTKNKRRWRRQIVGSNEKMWLRSSSIQKKLRIGWRKEGRKQRWGRETDRREETAAAVPIFLVNVWTPGSTSRHFHLEKEAHPRPPQRFPEDLCSGCTLRWMNQVCSSSKLLRERGNQVKDN